MGNLTASSIFPLSFKTAAVAATNLDPILGTGVNANYSYIGFQLIEPRNLYALKKLMTHFKCSFNASVASGNQVIQKVAVGLTGPSVIVNYLPTSGVIEFSLDLAPLITPTGDDTLYLFFPAAIAPGFPGWAGTAGQIQVSVWKVDMLYQVLGVR